MKINKSDYSGGENLNKVNRKLNINPQQYGIINKYKDLEESNLTLEKLETSHNNIMNTQTNNFIN